MIAKYRKLPVVIEALHFTESTTFDELDNFIKCDKEIFTIVNTRIPNNVVINTLEGDMQSYWGDYIIKGVKGEFYPCRGDIFVATYEKV